MKHSEPPVREDGVVPFSQDPATEVKTALSGFLTEFNGFQAEMKTKLKQQEERLMMLDRKSMTIHARHFPQKRMRPRPIKKPLRHMCVRGMMTPCAGWR